MKRLAAVLAGVAIGLSSAEAARAQSLSEATPEVSRPDGAPDSFAGLARRLMPSVVNINTRQTVAPAGLPDFPEGSPLERFNPFFNRDDDGFRQRGSLGSGFVISADGLVITNNHVIEGADEITAIFNDGTVLEADLIGTDPDTDVAVLRLKTDKTLPFVEFADSDAAEVGDWVIAIGNPFGFGGSVSAGIISARNRDTGGRYDDFIQTDAAINRGNSGGPLFNLGGEVVGVNTAIISPTGGSVGIGFSIPSNMVRDIADRLVRDGTLRRGWLGVSVQGIDTDIAAAYGLDDDKGVIITSFTSGGPAEKADFEIGDLIRRFDGEVVADVRSLTRIVADIAPETEVDVEIVRSGRPQVVRVTLGELETGRDEPEEEQTPELAATDNAMGVELAELDDETRRRQRVPKDVEGVLVSRVSPRGPAFGKLRKGDVLVELGFNRVYSLSDVSKALESAASRPEAPLLVRVHRNGVEIFVSVELEPTS